jgi:hypothetical protein
MLQEKFKNDIVGSIVLTGYNNKTYQIDGVDFSSSPESSFYWHGREVCFISYFFQVSIS